MEARIISRETRIRQAEYDTWLREFQLENGNFTEVTPLILRNLGGALHDDIPLGYEASMRLASWVLNAAHQLQQFEDAEETCEHTLDELAKSVESLTREVERMKQQLQTLTVGDIFTCDEALLSQNSALRAKVKHQAKQLSEVQDALNKRNNGEMKRRWDRERKQLLDKIEELEDYKRKYAFVNLMLSELD